MPCLSVTIHNTHSSGICPDMLEKTRRGHTHTFPHAWLFRKGNVGFMQTCRGGFNTAGLLLFCTVVSQINSLHLNPDARFSFASFE